MRRFLTTCCVVGLVAAGVPAATASAGTLVGRTEGIEGYMCQGLQATLVLGEGSDVGTAEPGDDVIVDLGGDDQIAGGGGDDTICAGPGDDLVYGDDLQNPNISGNDTLDGGPGQDVIAGMGGNDRLIGGSGGCPGWECFDGALFAGAAGGVTANLETGQASGEGTDTLEGFESLGGSLFADTLVGDENLNLFVGFDGDDDIDGAGGCDFVSNVNASEIDLSSGTADGDGSDTLIRIEGAFGSEFDDTLIGDDNPNIFDGSFGDDTIRGGGGNDYFFGSSENDTIDGGAGNLDAIDYLALGRKIVADLAAGTVKKGNQADRVSGVEAVGAGNRDDVLRGSNGADLLFGEGGNDLIVARGGNDGMDGGRGKNRLDGGSGTDSWWRADDKKRCERHRRPKPPPLEAVANRARHR
jgi:Ca2+-binding RTX toxin-like protein